MVPNPVSGSTGRNRLSRRPFGPREHAKDGEGLADDSITLASQQAPSIPWVLPSEASSETAVSAASSSVTVTARRPLPPRPRRYLDDIRKRPLPSASASGAPQRVDAKDVPFVFSPRVSQPEETYRDPIKDPFGTPEGVPSDAPIWKSYMDEARRHDQSNVSNWNQNMDVILIFAGLFSAILTAFLVEFYHPLQPDLQQETVDKLSTITHLLEASLSGRNVSTLPPPIVQNGPYQPQTVTVIVNILWFVSLTLSLGAAMGAMIIKQWLQFYTSGLSTNPYEFAHQHQYRYDALLEWHVPGIISSLPFIMLVSVGLFLTGLGLQLLQLNLGVAVATIICMAAICLFYITSLILSLLFPSCPYKTSAMQLWHAIGASLALIVRKITCLSTPRDNANHDHLHAVNSQEVQEIREKQEELAVNGLSWLLGSSQHENIIDDLLLSVSRFAYTDNMVQKLQACHTMDQLVLRAFVPLPSWGHDFWKDLPHLSPSHPFLVRLFEATVHMKTLITIWHHPAYLGRSRPHPISERHTLERKRKALELKATPDLSYTCLLGNWLLFWRLLRANHNDLFHMSQKGYDLNTYAHVVCTEVYHYHLQRDVTPLYLPQNRGAFIDLHEILENTLYEAYGELYLTEESMCLLLDTMAYVFSGIENAPLELQGLPRTWFSPSQSPSLMRKETVLLLVKLLAKNQMQYNLVSKKLLLCLQMLLPVPMIAASRKAFFLKYQQESPSETELFEQMTMTLQGLIHVFVPSANTQPPSSTSLTQESHFPIASLALRQLVHSHMRVETPSHHHDSLFLKLPSAYVDDLLGYLASYPLFLCPKTSTTVQISWLLDLLAKWYQNGTLSQSNVESVVTIFVHVCGGTPTERDPDASSPENIGAELGQTRPDAELNVLLRKAFEFLGRLWKNSDPFYGQLVSRALRDILCRSFERIGLGVNVDSEYYKDLQARMQRKDGLHNAPTVLAQFIQMQVFGAIVEYLDSDECTEKAREGWLDLAAIWEEKAKIWYTPSAQEVFQLEGLKKALGRHKKGT